MDLLTEVNRKVLDRSLEQPGTLFLVPASPLTLKQLVYFYGVFIQMLIDHTEQFQSFYQNFGNTIA